MTINKKSRYSHKHTATQFIVFDDIEYTIKDCPISLKLNLT